jgi:hypothetical protein
MHESLWQIRSSILENFRRRIELRDCARGDARKARRAAGASANLGCRLKFNAGLEELVVLSTCNRVEVYDTAPWIQGGIHRVFQQLCLDVDVIPHVYVKENAEAVEHLFSVTSGLDSMVIGETEITGQVKNASLAATTIADYRSGDEPAVSNGVPNWQGNPHATAIGRGATWVGSVAVELAEKIFADDLTDKTVRSSVPAKWVKPACVTWPSAVRAPCGWPTGAWNALRRWLLNSAAAR